MTNGILDNGFSVATMDTKWADMARYPEPATNNGMALHKVRFFDVDDETQAGVVRIPATSVKSGRVQVSVVSNQANHILPSAYEFGAE